MKTGYGQEYFNLSISKKMYYLDKIYNIMTTGNILTVKGNNEDVLFRDFIEASRR